MTVAAVASCVVHMQIGARRCLVLLDIHRTVHLFKSGSNLATNYLSEYLSMNLTTAQEEALSLAYDKRGSVYAGWQCGLRGRQPPKGSTLQALARKGLVTLTKRTDGLLATLTPEGWSLLEVKPERDPKRSNRTRRDPSKLGPYFLLTNRNQEDQALDEKHTQIVDINPLVFLDLTTERGAEDFIKNADGIIDVNFYNSPAIQKTIRVHPHLSIDAKSGRVTGHEGRHRAASVLKAGGRWFRISIKLTPSSRNYRPEQMPQTWYGQFTSVLSFSVPRLLSTDRLRIIDDNIQRQYQKK